MTAFRRRARIVATGSAVLALASLVTACDKPQPKVTVLSGPSSTLVTAQPECVAMAKCNADGRKIARIKAAAGSRILVDVPKELAKSGWLVAAFTSDGSGKNTPVSDGGSLPVKDKHTVRLQVPPAKEGGYFLQVLPAPGSTERSTWVIQVQLTA